MSYAISDENFASAKKRFEMELGKEAPPIRTLRYLRSSFLNNLTILPQPSLPKTRPTEIYLDIQQKIVTVFDDGLITSKSRELLQVLVWQLIRY